MFRRQQQHQPPLPPPPPPPPLPLPLPLRQQQQQQHRARGGFDVARLQALVPPEMRAGHQATTCQSSQGMGSIAIADSQSEASTLTSSQQGSSQDNIALLQQPSMEDKEEPEKPDKGPCRLLCEEKNWKKTLMSMLVGLESEDGWTLGDAFQEPYFSMKQRAQHVINNEHLQKEILRRAEVADIRPQPKPSWWNKERCMKFLNKCRVDDPVDKAWLLQVEASIVEAIKAQQVEMEVLNNGNNGQEKASASSKWTDMCPWLRLHMCMCDDRARSALSTRDDAWDRATLDARNNDDLLPNWCQVVAELYNNPEEVFTTESLPFLHTAFGEQIDLKFQDMPGGAIDAEDVKKRCADSRSSLITIIYDWEQSGNGFGQRNIKKDSSWGHFTDEHLESEDGDNRANFLPRKERNKEHLLCFWHLSDTENILCAMLNVLSKDVSIDCDGKVKIDTQSVQHKRKKTVEAEMEAKEKRIWRGDLTSSMKSMAITQAEDNLQKTENEAAECEVKELEASTTPVRKVCMKRKEALQIRVKELQEDLAEMRAALRMKRTRSDDSTTNASNNSTTNSSTSD